jgi:lysozyme
MSLLSPRMPARRTVRLAVGPVLLMGALILGGAPAVREDSAHVGATGLHDGMMPTDSPDGQFRSSPPEYRLLAGVAEVAHRLPTGVDVARYQHPHGAAVDWDRVAASGQRFAIVKATELYAGPGGRPVLYTNSYLHSDLDGAHAAGLVVGSYAFAHPEFSAVTQADDFAAAIGALPDGSLPPVLDLEASGGLPVAALQSWTQAFLDRLEQDTGTMPMIYTGPVFWNSFMGGTTAFARYPLWEAHWTQARAPARFGGWRTYTLWQFTGTAVVPGISSSVDQNRFNGTL